MTDRELQRLNRKELLEILVQQGREIDRLQAEVEDLETRLKSKEIRIRRAGSIAEAALELNGVFEAAQAAADQYLENIRKKVADCESMSAGVEARAKEIIAGANKRAAAIEAEAKLRAKRYQTEAGSQTEVAQSEFADIGTVSDADEND